MTEYPGPLQVAFDVDGTVINSLPEAMIAAEDILELFGSPAVIGNRLQMRERFGRAALLQRFGEPGRSIALIHPLLMRSRGLAGPPPAFAGMVEVIAAVASATGEPPTFFTAGYSDSATVALAAAGVHGAVVVGRESGSKTEQIARWAANRPGARYVCDTVTDVHRCRRAGAQAVGVAWGYDPVTELENAGAVPVLTPGQLRAFLLTHCPRGEVA